MELTRDEAAILLDVIDAATESNWRETKDTLVAMGRTGGEVFRTVSRLAAAAHRVPVLDVTDCDF